MSPNALIFAIEAMAEEIRVLRERLDRLEKKVDVNAML